MLKNFHMCDRYRNDCIGIQIMYWQLTLKFLYLCGLHARYYVEWSKIEVLLGHYEGLRHNNKNLSLFVCLSACRVLCKTHSSGNGAGNSTGPVTMRCFFPIDFSMSADPNAVKRVFKSASAPLRQFHSHCVYNQITL